MAQEPFGLAKAPGEDDANFPEEEKAMRAMQQASRPVTKPLMGSEIRGWLPKPPPPFAPREKNE
jgi:hypothetical protein